jgi:hypothetical protein
MELVECYGGGGRGNSRAVAGTQSSPKLGSSEARRYAKDASRMARIPGPSRSLYLTAKVESLMARIPPPRHEDETPTSAPASTASARRRDADLNTSLDGSTRNTNQQRRSRDFIGQGKATFVELYRYS